MYIMLIRDNHPSMTRRLRVSMSSGRSDPAGMRNCRAILELTAWIKSHRAPYDRKPALCDGQIAIPVTWVDRAATGALAVQPQGRQLADDASAKRQHAGDEDRADNDRDPAADDLGQVLLQRNDDRGAHYRAKERSGTAQQGHQDHLPRVRLQHV